MGIHATNAFGRTEPEVATLASNTAASVEAILAELVSAAEEAGRLAKTLDAGLAAGFLYAALQGLTVRAQAGAGRDELANVASFTIEALKAMLQALSRHSTKSPAQFWIHHSRNRPSMSRRGS